MMKKNSHWLNVRTSRDELATTVYGAIPSLSERKRITRLSWITLLVRYSKGKGNRRRLLLSGSTMDVRTGAQRLSGKGIQHTLPAYFSSIFFHSLSSVKISVFWVRFPKFEISLGLSLLSTINWLLSTVN